MSIFSKLFGSRKFEIPQEELSEQQNNGQNISTDEEPVAFDNPKTETISFEKDKEQANPTDIPEGIRYIVESQGKDYLTSRGFINILNDFHLLKNQKAIRNVLLNIQQDGLMDELINASSFQLSASTIKKKLIDDYGVKETIVSYVVDSIGYGLSSTEIKPVLIEETQTTRPVQEELRIEINVEPAKPKPVEIKPYDPKLDLEYYRYPTLDLLKIDDGDGKPFVDIAEQTENKDNIVNALNTLGVQLTSIKATVGFSVTLFELTLAPGVRISRIRNNEQDISIRLATRCRIIAPIPGKGTIGIEIPNRVPSIVSMRSLINSKFFQESSSELPCLIGKSIDNISIIHDLAKENLLIAGAAGQGRKFILNSIILSLLYKKHPAELKIILIDPIGDAFNVYKSLDNHFLAAETNNLEEPIVTFTPEAVATLTSLCYEMEARLSLLKSAAVGNIEEYNQKFTHRYLNPERGHKYIPHIVLAIAEYSDYLRIAGQEFEQPLMKLAQRGAIVGIHIVIATQTPSNKVVNPTIKMNFPTRIAFRVASHLDSAAVLDQQGAEKLIGNGDMLYSQGLSLTRVQSPSVDELEVYNVCQYISVQQGYFEPYELPDTNDEPQPSNDVDMNHLDPMFEDAARLIVKEQSGSTSLIQRKFAIGYNRAGRLMDQLEKAGIVGRAYGSKPREVLVRDSITLDRIICSLRY